VQFEKKTMNTRNKKNQGNRLYVEGLHRVCCTPERGISIS